MPKEIAPPIEEEIENVKAKGLKMTPEFVNQFIDVMFEMICDLKKTKSTRQ